MLMLNGSSLYLIYYKDREILHDLSKLIHRFYDLQNEFQPDDEDNLY